MSSKNPTFFREVEEQVDSELVPLLIEAFEDELGHRRGSRYRPGAGQHFLLPGMPGTETGEDLSLIREDLSSWRAQEGGCFVGGSVFAKVEQGAMWVLPTNTHPRLFLSMSECSALLASNEDHLFVAHVSYSECGPTKKVLDFFLDHRIDLSDIFVVASVGPQQMSQGAAERMSTAQMYEDLGIQGENIHTFSHSYHFNEYDGIGIHDGLTRVIVSPEDLFIDTATWECTFPPGSWGPKYVRQDGGGSSHIINL